MDPVALTNFADVLCISKPSHIKLSADLKRSLNSSVTANKGGNYHTHVVKLKTRTLSSSQSLCDTQSLSVKENTTPGTEEWVHFIGIGGNGLSALAFYALKKGWHVTGSDITASKKLDDLQKAGAIVYIGHHESQICGKDSCRLPDYVVFSSAVPEDNVELTYARKCGLKTLKRGPWLAQTTYTHDLVAVSGSHGKSTTAAMLSIILREIDPGVSSVVGADIPQFPGGGSIICGSGTTFILEADEYDSCFLSLTPQLSLILNIDWEHVDMFPDKKAVKKHFTEFCRRLKPGGTLIYCGESESAHAVASEFMAQGKIPDDDAIGEVISYGLEDKNMWQAVMIKPNAYGGSDYLATYNGEVMTPVQIQLPGIHNVLNSLAAIAAAVVVASWKNTDDGKLLANIRKHISETAARSLYSFQGVHRRLEFVGKLENCHFYDDYAHHPTEISASLKAAREKFGNSSIWVIFQPQDYSRVSRLSKDFAVALAAADRVIVTQIYAARGKTAGGVSGQDIVDQIMGTSALYIQSMDDVYVFLSAELSTLLSSGQKDTLVVITMGTGSCTNLGPRLLQRFMS